MPSVGETQTARAPVVGLLQNQWFKDPVRAARLLAMYEKREPGAGRERFIRDFLFFGCKTGKRLMESLGGDGNDYWHQVIWEEVSPLIGGQSSAVFSPDCGHVCRVLNKFRPRLLVCYGNVACGALAFQAVADAIKAHGTAVYRTFHPAARGPDVVPALAAIGNRIRTITDIYSGKPCQS